MLSERAWLDPTRCVASDGVERRGARSARPRGNYLQRPEGGGNRWGIAGVLIALHTDRLAAGGRVSRAYSPVGRCWRRPGPGRGPRALGAL